MKKSSTKTQPAPPPIDRSSESIRETIDSIVIAFILAFVFRAFVVEAFVIPTGSMASTLNGVHGTMVCENCGWEYAYGLTDDGTLQRIGQQYAQSGLRAQNEVNEHYIARCRNCRFANPTKDINDRRRNQEAGDRILVHKWPFDIAFDTLGPKRWNVIVFKDPSDGVTNYIKRLAGMPGEVLEIIDGDVYTAPVEELTAESRATLDQLRHLKFLRRTFSDLRSPNPARRALAEIAAAALPAETSAEISSGLEALDRQERALRRPMQSLIAELDTRLTIQRKTPLAQKDLWRVAYNHDYPPRERGPEQPYWSADHGADHWTINPRTLEFTGIEVNEQAVQLFAGLDSFCAYNTQRPSAGGRIPVPQDLANVADLRLRFVIDYRGGDGSVRAILSKRNDVFAGEISADGTVRLLHRLADGEPTWRVLGEARVAPLVPGQLTDFAIHNLDYEVAIEVDDRLIITTDAEQYGPNVNLLRRNPSPTTRPPVITANHLDIVLRHVVVENDVYYLSNIPRGAAPMGYAAWGVTNNPILLRDGEYFMLGDNSAQSKDSRLWDLVGPHLVDRGEDYQLGTVPQDQLIGRAFFVYWPAGLRTSLIPFLRDKGIIPNFGRMRWIR